MSKFSQDVRNLGFSWEKNKSVFRKEYIFSKSAEISKFGVKCDWKTQPTQSVQNLVSLIEIYGFFEKNCFFKKTVLLAEMLKNATQLIEFSKRSKFRFFYGKIWLLFEKSIAFFQKIADRSNLALKCDWKSKTSKTFKNWFCQIKYMGFRKKIDLFKIRQRWKVCWMMQLN